MHQGCNNRKKKKPNQNQNQIIIAQIFFTENLLAIEMRKTQIFMDKTVCFGLSILELCKILMYDFWFDYIKPKYKEKVYYMDKDSFIIVYIKTDDIFKDIAKDD